jgi:hypothetical protein
MNRSAPVQLRLRDRGRLIFVWLYRLFPSRKTALVAEPYGTCACGP